jgi:hypothetical protein
MIFLGPAFGFRTERNSGLNMQGFANMYSKWVCESLRSQKRINARSPIAEGWTGSLMRRQSASLAIAIFYILNIKW